MVGQHEWFKSKFGFICCLVCMVVQNEGNKDKLCKGPSKLVFKTAYLQQVELRRMLPLALPRPDGQLS